MTPVVLTIDQSTSATKAILFSAVGEPIDKESRPHAQLYPQPGWVEHDAEEIYRNVLATAAAVLDRNPEARESAVALSITNQRETAVVFERGSGEPLHPAIVWLCRRGDPVCAQLREAGHGPLVATRTGLKLDTYFSASKLTWLVREHPELAARMADGSALVGTVDSYLVYRLTGGAVHATDATNASRTLLFDLGRRRWDPELCALFEVPLRALPEVRDSTGHFGETDLGGLLGRPLPIVGVMGDSQASLFAQRCYQPGSAKVTFGTGSSVLVNVGQSKPSPRGGAVAALAWLHRGEPTYALEGIINYSSATVAWLVDRLGLLEDAAESETLAESVPDNGGVYLVPAFAGLGAPHWDPDARAAVVGLSAHSTKAHVARAALESVGYQIRDVLEMIASESGVAASALHADGGPTANRFLMQFVADITATELVVSDAPDLSALGAAFAGLLGTGMVPDLDALAALPRPATTFSPALPARVAARLAAGWDEAVARVRWKPGSLQA